MIKAQTPARDITREHVFLAAAAGFSSPSEFVEHCIERLVQGELDFGDRWTRIGLAGFVRELREEAADLGAWSALAVQAADLEQLPAETVREIGEVLERVARRGAQAHFDAGRLARLVSGETNQRGPE